jgi:hypothetical protein
MTDQEYCRIIYPYAVPVYDHADQVMIINGDYDRSLGSWREELSFYHPNEMEAWSMARRYITYLILKKLGNNS